jgi:alpha-mannosidase
VDPIGQTLRIQHTLRAPKALAESRYERDNDHVDLQVETIVTLLQGEPLIRFHTSVQNSAQDHRLRVHIALPFPADHAHAEDTFGLVRRPAQPDAPGEWAEHPVGTAPHQGAVAVHGDSASCVLVARGLPEYELLSDKDGTAELALTLLRCTGWLSRPDLPNRPGDAGPAIPTPEAQCPGHHSFAYALAFGAAPWRTMLARARAFASDLSVHVGTCTQGRFPATASLVDISAQALVLSTLKPAEDGRGAILRLYNDDERPHTGTISLLIPVSQATIVTLGEQDGQVLFAGEPRTRFSIEVQPAQVVSIRLTWAV